MKKKHTHILFMLLFFLALQEGCNSKKGSAAPPDLRHFPDDSISSHNDTLMTDEEHPDMADEENPGESEQYKRVKNLLEFHARDTMKQDSTYIATLAMSKEISPAELRIKLKDIVEPGSKLMLKDTTQEISVRMSATLEDKASEKDPDFLISPIGGISPVRTYDTLKNKMIWEWNVTPVKEGYHELILSISEVDYSGMVLGSPETRRHSIIIFAERGKRGFGKSIGPFLDKYWQWMVGAILIPVFIAWFTTRRRRKAEEYPKQSVPAGSGNKNRKRKTKTR